MAASAGGGVVTKQPLILHTPLPSRTASPQKLPALKDEGDAASRTEKGGHSNSDSRSQFVFGVKLALNAS